MSRASVALAVACLIALPCCSRVEKLLGRGDPPPAASAPAPASAAGAPRPLASGSAPSPRAKAALPDGYVNMAVGGVTPTAQGNALLLVDTQTHMAVPIFIGDTEALSIQLRLEKRRYERPLTHDLLDSMVRRLDGEVDSVRVDKLENNVFYGTVVVRRGDRLLEFDARSSDAVALAVGNGVPIHVAKSVVKRAGVSLDEVHGGSPHDFDADAGATPRRPEGVSL